MPSQWNDDLSTLTALIAALNANGPKLLANDISFPTIAALEADAVMTAGLVDGTFVRVLAHGGTVLKKVSGATFDYEAASGARFVVEMEVVRPEMFGAVGDDDGSTGTDDRAALDAAMASGARVLDLAGGRYFYDAAAFTPSIDVTGGRVRDQSIEHDYRPARSVPAMMSIEYALASGVAGAGLGIGWNTVPFNTTVRNTIVGASRVGAAVTLPAGVYAVSSSVGVLRSGTTRGRLANGAGSEVPGFAMLTGYADNSPAQYAPLVGSGLITLAAPETLTFAISSGVANPDNGFGFPSTIGGTNRFAQAHFTKLA
ncbi:hypothetical protein [Tropicimonas sp. S265A]|uniref:hypothetical protein n=1 Tax=Tropicimonas sp. S265A TaxID=3415134 RepID=UPI003C7EB9F7